MMSFRSSAEVEAVIVLLELQSGTTIQNENRAELGMWIAERMCQRRARRSNGEELEYTRVVSGPSFQAPRQPAGGPGPSTREVVQLPGGGCIIRNGTPRSSKPLKKGPLYLYKRYREERRLWRKERNTQREVEEVRSVNGCAPAAAGCNRRASVLQSDTSDDNENVHNGVGTGRCDDDHSGTSNDDSEAPSKLGAQDTSFMMPIGEGHASVPQELFNKINWKSHTAATRKLLSAVFSRRVLATHSLTGKASPAFPDKLAKKRLDPDLIADIIQTVSERCKVSKTVVRSSITTKCADESKMYRSQKKKENVRPRRNRRFSH